MPARLERVDHPQRQHVVAIAADVGVEDQPDRLGGLCPAACIRLHCQTTSGRDRHDHRQDRLRRHEDARAHLTGHGTALATSSDVGSGQKLFDHVRRLDAGQALVEPLVAVREPAMVEPQELEHGGVEVADVHRVLDDVVGEVVGLAVDRARAASRRRPSTS